MFDIGWSELLVIAVVAIVVVGPKDLPRALRTVGQWSGRIKRMAREFQSQFTEAIKEAELDGLQRDIESITKIDPVADLRSEAAKTEGAIRRDLEAATPQGSPREPYPWEVKAAETTPAAPVATPAEAPALAPSAPAAPMADPAAVEPKP